MPPGTKAKMNFKSLSEHTSRTRHLSQHVFDVSQQNNDSMPFSSKNSTKVARKKTMSMTMMMRMMMRMMMTIKMMTKKLKSRYLAMMIRMTMVILQFFEARLLSFYLSVVNSTQL